MECCVKWKDEMAKATMSAEKKPQRSAMTKRFFFRILRNEEK